MYYSIYAFLKWGSLGDLPRMDANPLQRTIYKQIHNWGQFRIAGFSKMLLDSGRKSENTKNPRKHGKNT